MRLPSSVQNLKRPPPVLLALAACLGALVGAALVSTYVFERLAHVEDEVAFLFQARTIASGRLLAGAPALPEFFSMPFIILRDGYWFGKYPPGFPAVLALGALFGQPWLVNPIFGALSAGLVYLMGRRFYGPATGVLAAGLAAASPFFLLQAGSLLSHVVSLFWTMAFILLFDATRRGRSRAAALGAGSALGAVLISRPLTAMGIALPFVLWATVDVLRERRRLMTYLPLVAGFLPFLAGLLGYNWLTTGDPLRSAYELWWPHDRVGFGEGIGISGSHSLEQGIFETRLNVDALGDYLFGWPGRLSLVPAYLASGLAVLLTLWRSVRWAAGRRRGSGNAAGGLVTHEGHEDPPRALLSGAGFAIHERRVGLQRGLQGRVFLVLLRGLRGAAGLVIHEGHEDSPRDRLRGGVLLAWLRVLRGRFSSCPSAGHFTKRGALVPETWDMLLIGVVVSLVGVHVAYWAAGQMYGPRYYFEAMGALLLLSARGILQAAGILSVPLRLVRGLRNPRAWAMGLTLLVTAALAGSSFGGFLPQELGRFKGWYGVDGTGLRTVEAAALKNALVFVQETHWTGYAPFFSRNLPSLDGDVVYAIDLGPGRDEELMACYPGRDFFKYAEGKLEGLQPP